jgi:23S rRNA pseudouridine2605 synthase
VNEPTNAPDSIRLNKYLAQCLNVGRRAGDELIAKGKVIVNGQPADLGSRVHPGDEIIVQGKHLHVSQQTKFIYVLMNKPRGYVCSRRQQGDVPTVYSLLHPEYQHLKTVGRLDKDSSGLILLTNDGDLAHQLTHPSYAKVKKYEVTLDKPLQPLHHQMINDIGLLLPDGVSKLQLTRMKDNDSKNWQVTMHEGRNRQIRRTFAALGYLVTKLHRTDIGNLSSNQMKIGQIMEIERSNIN